MNMIKHIAATLSLVAIAIALLMGLDAAGHLNNGGFATAKAQPVDMARHCTDGEAVVRSTDADCEYFGMTQIGEDFPTEQAYVSPLQQPWDICSEAATIGADDCLDAMRFGTKFIGTWSFEDTTD